MILLYLNSRCGPKAATNICLISFHGLFERVVTVRKYGIVDVDSTHMFSTTCATTYEHCQWTKKAYSRHWRLYVPNIDHVYSTEESHELTLRLDNQIAPAC